MPTTVLAIALLALGCEAASTPAPPDLLPPPPDLALPSGIFRFDENLDGLEAVIGDARDVGLGESVHTTDGFTRAKFRVWKRLVEQHGFRVLAFEWQRTSGVIVEQYLMTGTPSSTSAARGLSVWASEGTREMLEWMRAWNLEHPGDLLHFFGFDVQQPEADAQTLEAFAPALAAGLATCRREYELVEIPESEYRACLDGITAIERWFVTQPPSLELEWARVAAAGLRAWQEELFSYYTDQVASMEARDRAMAFVYLKTRALLYPEARIVVWAHNEHLSMDHPAIENAFGEGGRSMGTFLAAQLGAQYRPIALTGYDISIDWPNVGCGPLPPPAAPNAVENLLRALGAGDLLVDLETAFFSPETKYVFGFDQELIPRRQFRGLVYLERVDQIEPLSWPSCD